MFVTFLVKVNFEKKSADHKGAEITKITWYAKSKKKKKYLSKEKMENLCKFIYSSGFTAWWGSTAVNLNKIMRKWVLLHL